MLYLIISLLALGVGPLIVLAAGKARSAIVAVDAFVLVVVGGLVFLHVLPESLTLGGWSAVLAAIVGALLPLLAERGMRPAQRTRGLVIGAALIGLTLHTMIDGAALVDPSVHERMHGGGESAAHSHGAGPAHSHSHSHGHGGAGGASHQAQVWAVIAHRVPVGIGIWWIVGRTLGVGIAILTLLITMAGTVTGYVLGGHFLTDASETAVGVFQALLCGSLLHVLLHAHIPAPREGARPSWNVASVVGGVLAGLVVWFVQSSHSHEVDGQSAGAVFARLALESAPILLLAYLIAGVAHVLTPERWIERINRGGVVGQAMRGIAVGLPLPVCSCGVVPIYRGLVARGAAVAAAIGFLIATPELEIAAVFITWELLGGEVALARVGAAALLALLVGVTIGWIAKRRQAGEEVATELPAEGSAALSAAERVRSALRTGFVDMVDQTAPWILLGLGVSAMLSPHLDPETITSLPVGLDVPLAAALGMPLYVCASGSTPLAAVFVLQGLSPGAAVAFLLTGPATNVTTFGVLKDLHGRGTALAFTLAMFLGAILLGYGVNGLMSGTAPPIAAAMQHDHSSPLALVCVVLLAILVLGSVLRRGTRGFMESIMKSPHGGGAHAHDHGAHTHHHGVHAHGDHSSCH